MQDTSTGGTGVTNRLCDDFDIHDAEFVRDPYPAYGRLRSECPVAHGSRHGGYSLLTRYADVRDAARDWRTYTSSVVGVTAIPVITPRTEPQLPIELDPPEHSTYRALINPLFAVSRVEQLRPRIQQVAKGLATACSMNPSADLVRDYAVPLSVSTLAEFTGLPRKDTQLWVDWITRMFDVRDRETGAQASQQFGKKRLLPVCRAAGYAGSARNLRRAVALAKGTWRRDRRTYRRWVPIPGEHLVIDWGSEGGLQPPVGTSTWPLTTMVWG